MSIIKFAGAGIGAVVMFLLMAAFNLALLGGAVWVVVKVLQHLGVL